VKEASMQSPKKDFAVNVMREIAAYEVSKNTQAVYQPLIGNKAWLTIGAIIIGFGCLVFFQAPTNEASLLDALDFSNFKFDGIAKLLNNIQIPKTFLYSFTILSLMLFLQIPILKNIFQKRWN
jgi:hypothetical protein